METTVTVNSDVCELVRKAENDYVFGTTTISKYVETNQYETLARIDAYLNSKHTTGDTDSQGRDKPFFNIVTAAVNVWYRATDIDRKNIKIKADRQEQQVVAFLATVHLQRWMRKSRFGKFLNQWGRTLSKYGSAVTKFVEKNGELVIINVPWARIICDTVSFDDNPVIEKLELTPAQLREKKEYDQTMVEKLINAVAARTDLDGQRKDNKNNYIKCYEVHAKLALSVYKKSKGLEVLEGDDKIYRQQMHVISFLAKSEKETKFEDYTLFSGKEAKSPYQKDDLIEEDDQTLSIGAVQNLFDSQWMVNHSVKSIKDQLDLASKIVFQTADQNFVGQNVLVAIEQGDVLVHAPNMPITQVGNNSNEVTSQSNFIQMWKGLGNQINGISEAMMGQTQPQGTAWRQTQALLQESHSLFELMTQNKGLAIEDMMRERIIPFVKKKMDTTEEISATLDSYHISQIDSMFVPNEAIRRGNNQMIQQALSGQVAQQANYQQHQQQVQSQLQQQGNNRYFKPSDIPTKTWKSILNNFEWECEVDITGEQKDTMAVMETLKTALQFITTATPQQLQDPNFKLVFNKILEESAVISPIEIASIPVPPPQQPQNKVSESLSYKDAPADVQRQIEQQAGLQPSKVGQTQQPTNQPVPVK